MLRYQEQRVGIFVDVQNMYHTAKNLYNANVNFANILKEAVGERKLIRALAYVIRSQTIEEEGFFEALQNQGFELKIKDLQIFFGGAKKGDWDVGIAMDIMRLSSKLDVVVLVSGDGDFTELLKHVKALGCRAEVMAFSSSASSHLLQEADRFVDLSGDQGKFLLVKSRRKIVASSATRPAIRTAGSRTSLVGRRSSG